MPAPFRLIVSALAGITCLSQAAASVSVVDDAGNRVTLSQPARRIVSLAPHATELVSAAGAAAYLVGVAEHSDHPPDAKKLPSVGGSAALDIERIIALKPDLVVAWTSGNSAGQIARLAQMGLPIYRTEPRDFETIATSLERLARLAGTDESGLAEAAAFRQHWHALADRYRGRPPVRVFYQIWRAPLMTLNDTHLVSEALRLCGGRNVFGHLPQLTPAVSMETVVQANPQAIVTTTGNEDDPLAAWRRLTQLDAVKNNHLFVLDADLMHRPTPRMLRGVQALCEHLETTRGE